MGRLDTRDRANRALVAELVRRRKKAALTQWDIAKALHVDQSRISKFERLERRLDILDFVRFCRAVGADPGSLLRAIDL